ncbi:MAG: methylmalonyl-CoA mutase family protein, partial [Candidatus Poseidoniaceae archaeon]
MVDFRKDNWDTLGGIPIPSYHIGPDGEIPGQPPYTRGIHEHMYKTRLWTMRQYAGFSSAKETNERFRLLLDRGQKGLSVAFDLPTQLGLDADDPLSEGEVGKVGVSISTLEDMRELLDGIPLDKVSTSMTINAPAMVLLAMYAVVAEEQGVSMKDISGTIQNDILKEYIARGTYVFPPDSSMRLITDIFEYCSTDIPKW